MTYLQRQTYVYLQSQFFDYSQFIIVNVNYSQFIDYLQSCMT